MSSQMVNFRVKEGELAAIDAAAKVSGMDRSGFIRMAVERAVLAVQGAPKTVLASETGKRAASEKPLVKPEDCPHKKTAPTTFGIKICQDCGAKLR